jgi:hypothetical protein
MLLRSRSKHSDHHHGQILLCVRVEQYGDMESLQIYEVELLQEVPSIQMSNEVLRQILQSWWRGYLKLK